nr:hypothetical protein GCM10020092_098330 [Actinoplanes digitatis]
MPTELTWSPTSFISSIVGSSWNAALTSGVPPIRSPAPTVRVDRPSAAASERRRFRKVARYSTPPCWRAVHGRAAAAGRVDGAVEVVVAQELALDRLAGQSVGNAGGRHAGQVLRGRGRILGARHRQGGDDGQSEGRYGEMTRRGPAAEAGVVHSIRSPDRVTDQPTETASCIDAGQRYYFRVTAWLRRPDDDRSEDICPTLDRATAPENIVGGAA